MVREFHLGSNMVHIHQALFFLSQTDEGKGIRLSIYFEFIHELAEISSMLIDHSRSTKSKTE
jgi:hypothetical protein